jgi:hypothetical protein
MPISRKSSVFPLLLFQCIPNVCAAAVSELNFEAGERTSLFHRLNESADGVEQEFRLWS